MAARLAGVSDFVHATSPTSATMALVAMVVIPRRSTTPDQARLGEVVGTFADRCNVGWRWRCWVFKNSVPCVKIVAGRWFVALAKDVLEEGEGIVKWSAKRTQRKAFWGHGKASIVWEGSRRAKKASVFWYVAEM